MDVDTFLTILYTMADDFLKKNLPRERTKPGPKPSLSCSEVVTLITFAQFWKFRSERDFYRYAERNLKGAFPSLPSRPQFNRLVRRNQQAIITFFLYLVKLLKARMAPYEVLDTTGVPLRNVKRRGRNWLSGFTNIGLSTRMGWFEGFRLIMAVNPSGVITGFAFSEASVKEQLLGEDFLLLRRFPHPRILSVGMPALGVHVVDSGFGRWFAGIRQIVETVYEKLINWFNLGRHRPHDISGFHAHLAAKMVLHSV